MVLPTSWLRFSLNSKFDGLVKSRKSPKKRIICLPLFNNRPRSGLIIYCVSSLIQPHDVVGATHWPKLRAGARKGADAETVTVKGKGGRKVKVDVGSKTI